MLRNPGPLPRTVTTQLVADELRKMILHGQLAPGARIDLDQLASGLEVSRMPLREALRILEAESLVEILPHRGTVVTHMSLEQIEEISLIRQANEGLATRMAAQNIRPATLESLHTLAKKMAVETDHEKYAILHTDFHFAIYEAAGLPRLTKYIQVLWNQSERYRRAAFPDRGPEASGEHERLLDALSRRDPDAAEQAMKEHLRNTARHFANRLSSSGGERVS